MLSTEHDIPSAMAPHAAANGKLEVVMATSFETAAPKGEWDGCVLATGGGLYASHDWCRIWWGHYGSGRQLRLFTMRRGGALIGVLPMLIERLWVGPVWLKVARLVGADSTPTVCRLAVAPDSVQAGLGEAVPHMLEEERCDAVYLGPLGYDEPQLQAVRSAAAECGATIREKQLGVHTTFHLPATFDEYLGGLNKRQKQNYRRDVNLFTKNYKLSVDEVSQPATAQAEFEKFADMHAAQWRAEGKLGHFADWPRAKEFSADLACVLAEQGRFRLVRLLANEQVVSYQMSLTFGDWYYWRLPARQPSAEWDRFGLGRLGLIKMIELAIGAGFRHIEAGPGHYEYKVQLGAAETPLSSMLIGSPRLLKRLRAGLFSRAADLLHLFYYRGWFLKVAPRMPALQRPLWRSWIRSRL